MRMTPDKYDEKINALKVATREANEALAAVKTTLREVKKERTEIEKLIEHQFDEKIKDQVAESLATYQTALDNAVESSTQAVFDRFDKITAMLLGETKEARRKGPSVPEMIEARPQCPTCGGRLCKEVCVNA